MNTLLWGLLIGLAVFWLIRMMRGGGCCGGEEDHDEHEMREFPRSNTGVLKIDTVEDPVCGMTLDRETAEHTLSYNGSVHYFCSSNCYESFKADPAKYLHVHAH